VIVNKERVTLAARFDFRREYLDNETCTGEKVPSNREVDVWNRGRKAKMSLAIHPIKLGFEHCYLIQGAGCIMIDGGSPGQAEVFRQALAGLSLQPGDIQLIVLTHGHWDHIGSAQAIQALTGARLALHRQEKDWLEQSLKPLPPGVTAWGRVFIKIMALFMPSVRIPPAKVDVILGDEALSLAEYGIPGKIMPTPGHSRGSVSVVLETGDAFVGDLAMAEFPLRLSPGLPIFAEDMRQVRQSWQALLDAGVKTIYPAHGTPFPADIMRHALLM
jgi:hydroxyacylglutathione hydrolase